MTDDKGVGEGPYSVGKDMGAAWWAVSDTDGVLWRHESRATAFLIKQVSNLAYAKGSKEGRKAERERCAKIADDEAIEHQDGDESYMCGAVEEIAKRIRGGQDAK